MAGEVALRFGQRARQRRLELGLKQREVAERMGGAVTKQHISDWERGYNEPSDRYKLQLVEALAVPDVSWFYEAPNAPTPDVLAGRGGSQLDRIEANIDEILRLLRGEDETTAAVEEELVGRLPDELSRAAAGPKRQAPARSGKTSAVSRRTHASS